MAVTATQFYSIEIQKTNCSREFSKTEKWKGTGKKKKLSNLPNHALSMHDLENQMFSVQKKPNPPKKMPEKCFLCPLTNLFPQKNWCILGSDPSLGGSNLKSDAQIYVALS